MLEVFQDGLSNSLDFALGSLVWNADCCVAAASNRLPVTLDQQYREILNTA